VKSWKQQLRGASPPDDDVTNSIFGKDDWRKRKTLVRGNSADETPPTSPPATAQKGKPPRQKTFAGVAGFPPVDALTDGSAADDHSPRLHAPPTSNRSVSPYDNLKPPRHPTSQFESFAGKQQQRTTVPASRGKVSGISKICSLCIILQSHVPRHYYRQVRSQTLSAGH